MNLDEEILFYAFRYTLGRMTYAVSTVSDCIIKNWDELSTNKQTLIQKEIIEAINSDNVGMDMDRIAWERILKLKITQ
jgi:hypothetical protein